MTDNVTRLTDMTPGSRWLFGGLFVALGLFPALATFDIGPLDPDDVNGPPWLGFAAGGIFIAAGLAVIAGARRPLLNGALALLVLAGLASLGSWIAFGVGERVCAGSLPFWQGDLGGLACRIPFGIGAVVTNAVALLSGVVLLQRALGGPPKLARSRTWAEHLVLLSLAPVLIPVALVLIAGLALAAIRTRVISGR